MSAGLKPYPVYRDIGLPWLARLPERWSVKRGKELFRCIDERSASGAEELLTVSSSRGVVPRSTANVTMFKAESYVGYKLCWPGDLVINSLWAWAGGLGVSRHHGIISSAYGVYRLRDIARNSPAFVHELVRSVPFQWELQVRSKGIWTSRLQLTDQSFLEAPFPLPPADEQATIVRYLDFMDRRIRRFIRAKQKLVKLLEEQKRAIIEWMVTGKVDPRTGEPYAAYRDSGMDWLGEVPENWRVVRLKSLVSRVTSGSRGWSDYAADTGVLFIRVGNLTRASIGLNLDDVVRLRLPGSVLSGEATRTQVQAHDILLSITAYIGSVAVVPESLEEAYVSQHVACCRPRAAAANSKWVAYVLLSSIGQTHGQLSMYGGTKQGLSLDDVKNYIVVVPPAEEQPLLVERIEKACASVDTAIDEARQAVTLLREYRTRLIVDVVTGKLDVREAAASLPDDTDEPASLGDEDVLAEDGEARETADLGLAIEEVEA